MAQLIAMFKKTIVLRINLFKIYIYIYIIYYFKFIYIILYIYLALRAPIFNLFNLKALCLVLIIFKNSKCMYILKKCMLLY